MALFKVNRGKSENLPQERHNGWAYFCTDTAEFFIDYEDDSGIIQRKQLNAAEASRLIGYDIVNEINESSEVEIPTAKAILGHLGKYVSLPDRGAIIQLSEALLAALPELADGQQHTIEFTPDEEDTSEILEFQIQSAVQQHNTAVETHTDIRQEIISAKETLTTYVNDSIAAIPTPDVSGQIGEHNIAEDAHPSIRQEIANATDAITEYINTQIDEHVHSWNELEDKPFYENIEAGTVKCLDDKFISDAIARVETVQEQLDLKSNATNLVNGIAEGSLRTIFSDVEDDTYALGRCAFAQGDGTKASGYASHAEGVGTEALGDYSHAEGYCTKATGRYSHASGENTIANYDKQFVIGGYNLDDGTNYRFVVGNGAWDGQVYPSNAHTLDPYGNAWFAGDVYVDSTSRKNKDEGSKKLATEEYVDTVKNDLLNGAGEAYDTLKELGDLIDNNHDAIDALEIVAASKVAQTDFNSHVNNKNNPHGVTASQVGAPTVAEMNAAIAAIPTPDVSGQINTHNTSTTAHNDIRTLITNIVNGTTTIGKATSATNATNATSATNATNATNIYSSASTEKAYVLGTTTASSANHATVYNASVYTSGSVLYGAAWNDYAEYRISDCFEAGRVICENGDDTLSIATERLQPGANVISDTFGFAIGETEEAKTPIAVSGRVLVYTYENRNEFKAGDAVCAAPNGTVSKMTREEIREYPERIVGVVSAIPNYNTWGAGNVPVNNRIWIKVK